MGGKKSMAASKEGIARAKQVAGADTTLSQERSVHQRFPDSRIMYSIIDNHFAAEIDGRLYDVTGDVTGKYDVIPWDTFKDTDHGAKIIRDCINF